ncbi:hypothetical protein [uncultured Litoreibacter sp.]|uniref:hypothetical protein n=1 Tax=uncultured Litoreibacter sp. TaxID=1392394 RepID=UPI0026053B0B|nr:hypothetical protein [uncultured Litoreibacter sp.]
MKFTIMPDPTPGHFYRAQNNDTVLGLTGRAYGVRSGSTRMRLSQLLVSHPHNWRIRRPPKNKFERQFYPQGLIRLARRFPCADKAYEADPWDPLSGGSCRPLMYIPPKTDVWFKPPVEVVQRASLLCWAAALTSLSLSRDLNLAFPDQIDLASHFLGERITVGRPGRGSVRRRLVMRSNLGLRLWPRQELKADPPAHAFTKGEMTATFMARAFGLNINSYFGDLKPDPVNKKRDKKLTIGEIQRLLKAADNPIIMFRALGEDTKTPGHVSVVFGASEEDDHYLEMDPFTTSNSGSVFGTEDTITLRDGRHLTGDIVGHDAREIYVLH